MLMAAPKSTSTFGISIPLICTIRIEFPGSPYLTGMIFPNMISDSLLITCAVNGSLGFLLGLFEQYSFKVFA